MSSLDKKHSLKIDLEEGVEVCISVKASLDHEKHANEKEHRITEILHESKTYIFNIGSDQDLGGIVVGHQYDVEIHVVSQDNIPVALHQGWDQIELQLVDAPAGFLPLGVDGGPINAPALDGVLRGILTPKEPGTLYIYATVTVGTQQIGIVMRKVRVYSSK